MLPGVGLYLDGGFGVGKTHLLASAYRELSEETDGHRTAFATFMEMTQLAGVFGFAECVDLLGDYTLVCIDEFELDDPGNTTLIARMLSQLVLAGIFAVVRIEGPDYRHRDLPPAPEAPSDEQVAAAAEQVDGATLDDFDAPCAHLATMHPSRYLALIEGVAAVFLTGVHRIDDQNVALRLVALTDRLSAAGPAQTRASP